MNVKSRNKLKTWFKINAPKLWSFYSELKYFIQWHNKNRVLKKVQPVSSDVLANWASLPPQRGNIELTNICNANCIFCGYQYVNGRKGIMSDNMYSKTLQEFRNIGIDKITISPTVGENLIDEKFVDRINTAKNEGFKVIDTFTNGILLDHHDLKRLLLSGIDVICVSTAGFDAEEYVRIYRNNKYKRMLTGLSNLLKINKELGQPVRIYLLIRTDAMDVQVLRRKDYIEFIKPFINENTDISFCKYYDSWGGMIQQIDMPKSMKINRVFSRKIIPCYGTYIVIICWDGRVRACGCRFSNLDDKDELSIGHLEENSLREIWYGEKINKLREKFVYEDLPEICANCSMYLPAYDYFSNFCKENNNTSSKILTLS